MCPPGKKCHQTSNNLPPFFRSMVFIFEGRGLKQTHWQVISFFFFLLFSWDNYEHRYVTNTLLFGQGHFTLLLHQQLRQRKWRTKQRIWLLSQLWGLNESFLFSDLGFSLCSMNSGIRQSLKHLLAQKHIKIYCMWANHPMNKASTVPGLQTKYNCKISLILPSSVGIRSSVLSEKSWREGLPLSTQWGADTWDS